MSREDVDRDAGHGTRDSDGQAKRLFHEKLDVYLLSKELAIELFKATKTFPRSEQFGLVSQIRRAATSVPANIAEGAARRSKKEFVQFLSNARGSAAELRVLIEIAAETGNLSHSSWQKYALKTDRLSAMLSGLIRKNRALSPRVPNPESRVPTSVSGP